MQRNYKDTGPDAHEGFGCVLIIVLLVIGATCLVKGCSAH